MRAQKTARMGLRSVRRALLGAVAAALVAAGIAAAPAGAGTAVDVPVVHDGALRSYRLYVPGSLKAGTRVPLVLVLHGLGASPASTAAMTGFDALAERNSFVAVYPAGQWNSWNAGSCCGDASATGVDDVGFLTHVVADVSLAVPVDPGRVYAAGFSNGGMMALRAACERPDVFAAVASVMGTLEAPCAPKRPVSVLQVVGGRDVLVPYRGQAWSGTLRAPLTAVPVASGVWERGDLCSGLPARIRTAHAEVRSYARCAGGSAVRLVLLPRTGHSWPVSARDGWSATQETWRFLSGHGAASATRPQPVLATRIVATRAGSRLDGRLDGRFDVVIGRRLAVEVRRGARWVRVTTVTTDVEGRFRASVPRGERVRVTYAGGPGLPSATTVA